MFITPTCFWKSNNSGISVNSFDFISQINVSVNLLITSNQIVVTGPSETDAVVIAVENGEYSVNNEEWTTMNSVVYGGDIIAVRHYSSQYYSSSNSTTLYIGDKSGVFSTVTKMTSDLTVLQYTIINNPTNTSNEHFGSSIAVNYDGSLVSVGGTGGPGRIYMLSQNGTTYTNINTLTNASGYGNSKISIVKKNNTDYCFIWTSAGSSTTNYPVGYYSYNGTSWVLEQNITTTFEADEVYHPGQGNYGRNSDHTVYDDGKYLITRSRVLNSARTAVLYYNFRVFTPDENGYYQFLNKTQSSEMGIQPEFITGDKFVWITSGKNLRVSKIEPSGVIVTISNIEVAETSSTLATIVGTSYITNELYIVGTQSGKNSIFVYNFDNAGSINYSHTIQCPVTGSNFLSAAVSPVGNSIVWTTAYNSVKRYSVLVRTGTTSWTTLTTNTFPLSASSYSTMIDCAISGDGTKIFIHDVYNTNNVGAVRVLHIT